MDIVTEPGVCSVCGTRDRASVVAKGRDYEYGTTDREFEMYYCERCRAMFLHPRPARSELPSIYPSDYHAYEFTPDRFGLAYTVRRRLETRRLLNWCSSVPKGGRIIDVGAGDGFHLDLLRDFGDPTWQLEAVEPDPLAAEACESRGITVHAGFVEELDIEPEQYDFAIMIMVVEHLDRPSAVLSAVNRILKPGGRVGIVTDNIESIDGKLGHDSCWGGYHFPRHFHLFSRESLRALAEKTGFQVDRMTTMLSPVNWTYTVHNYLVANGAPEWLSNRFTLKSPVALTVFTAFDLLSTIRGRGALLRAVMTKPQSS